MYFLAAHLEPTLAVDLFEDQLGRVLVGMPQGAAGPESGVETPNLMTSAAPARAGLAATNAAAKARHPNPIRGDGRFIASPLPRS